MMWREYYEWVGRTEIISKKIEEIGRKVLSKTIPQDEGRENMRIQMKRIAWMDGCALPQEAMWSVDSPLRRIKGSGVTAELQKDVPECRTFRVK